MGGVFLKLSRGDRREELSELFGFFFLISIQ